MTRLDRPTSKRRGSPRALALGAALMAFAPWSQARADDLVHDDRAVGLLQTLHENVELVADLKVLAHVDAILEDVGKREGQLSALRARQRSIARFVESREKAGLNRSAQSERVDLFLVGRNDYDRLDNEAPSTFVVPSAAPRSTSYMIAASATDRASGPT